MYNVFLYSAFLSNVNEMKWFQVSSRSYTSVQETQSIENEKKLEAKLISRNTPTITTSRIEGIRLIRMNQRSFD